MSRASTDVAYLARALQMPRAREVAPSVAETARSEGWDYLEFLARVLSEEVASRETHGGEHRVKAARFPQVKTLDDFDFSHQRFGLKTTDRSPPPAGLPQRGPQRDLPGPTGDRQDPPVDRPGRPGGPPWLPGGVLHRHRVGAAALRSQAG